MLLTMARHFDFELSKCKFRIYMNMIRWRIFITINKKQCFKYCSIYGAF